MTFEKLNAAGSLAIGLVCEFVDQDSAPADYTGAPTSAADGVYLQGSPRCIVAVALRESDGYRTSRVVLGTIDLTTTVYTVTIDGNAVNYDAAVELPADATALVAGIALKIATDGTVGPIVNAVADPLAPTTTILITGKDQANYSVAPAVAGGTGSVSSFSGDAVSCNARTWLSIGGTVKSGQTGWPDRWLQPPEAVWAALDYRGLVERLDCASFARGYMELDTIAGHGADGAGIVLTIGKVMIGPSVLEPTR